MLKASIWHSFMHSESDAIREKRSPSAAPGLRPGARHFARCILLCLLGAFTCMTMPGDNRALNIFQHTAWTCPDHLLPRTLSLQVFTRSIDSGGKGYSAPGATNLPAGTTNVHFEYNAPNRSVPERVRFRYKLDAVDSDWQDAGSRSEACFLRRA